MIHKIGNLIFKVKQLIQRIFRRNHTADSDLWSLDTHLAEIIAKKLKAFRGQELQGHPSYFTELDDWPDKDNIPEELIGGGMEKWLQTIDEMIFAFECSYMFEGKQNTEFLKKYNYEDPHGKECTLEELINKKFSLDMEVLNEITARADKGRELFAKYFCSLWD